MSQQACGEDFLYFFYINNLKSVTLQTSYNTDLLE